ncbi:acetyl-CoA carboxylase biotin carboxyl carrier protein [Sphaerisporangium perillae]|uniref:acetyl-CoA carboxylase biotin carboxyl carrier protein n=1 Tax=Sphaerisporangium perillae TaxID=2935860 RepID=UPI00200F0275|nr:biotin/lipoyl-containing protein [Sphaerisporangium perillae]
MSAEPAPVDERERVLDWVVRHAARLGHAGPAPLRRITVSTATLALQVEWADTGPPGAGAPAPAGQTGQSGQSGPDGAEEAGDGQDGTIVITSPMVGTFYRAGEPGAPPFVEVGDIVEPGQQVGIIEAMKLMNAVQAEQGGRVSRIVATDGSPVQYEEPLLALVPHDGH